MDARRLIPLAAAALLAAPASATARTSVDVVRVTDRPGGGATVMVRGRWDRGLLRRSARQLGAVRITVQRGDEIDGEHTWRAPLRGTRSARFSHRFHLTRSEARGLWRGQRGARTRAVATASGASEAADLSVHASHLIDADADGDFEAGALSAAGSNCDSFGQGADLSGCDLDSAFLPGVDLVEANLENTQLSGAVLKGANLSFATAAFTIMAGTDLTDAEVQGTQFIAAKLIETDFTGANLTNSAFMSSMLNGATLTGATLTGTQCRDTVWTDGSTVPGPGCPAS